jgi:endogenous inhibitor of DNA gyrase (YacG/DUF329 family)
MTIEHRCSYCLGAVSNRDSNGDAPEHCSERCRQLSDAWWWSEETKRGDEQ